MAGGVAALVVTESVDELDVDDVTESEVGANDPEPSVGKPATLSATRPVNPPLGVTVTIWLMLLPAGTA